MERGNPTKEHMTALHGPINGPFEGKDVFYTDEELEGPREKVATTWV